VKITFLNKDSDKMPVKSLIFVKQLVDKKIVFLHTIAQAIRFKMPVKSLDSCQTIVRQKSVFSNASVQEIYNIFSKQLSFLSNILLPEMKIWSDFSQSISLQKCIQTANIFHFYCYLYTCLKKPGKFPYTFVKHL
jgi:hypothetical protein